MTNPRQVLLDLICYASDRGKSATLNVRPERISELYMRGLIDKREDGYWITELGRAQCQKRDAAEQDIRSQATMKKKWKVRNTSPRQALVPSRAASGPQHIPGDYPTG
jgi:hypothetical protein